MCQEDLIIFAESVTEGENEMGKSISVYTLSCIMLFQPVHSSQELFCFPSYFILFLFFPWGHLFEAFTLIQIRKENL